ncbi:unnamed protein product [Paramecium primaurelia]|uniref:3-dehydroquinate synthase N-terminal domain-containing protein n=1 Tax=Paramecium primaurelia TaxID=5886 RepID=A0A8S1KCS1_PARPR|nr:unnamed protein product [Paramecium primaurelia]
MKQQNTCLAKDFVDKIQQLQLEKEQLLTQWDFIQHIYERVLYIQLFNRIIFILIPTQMLGMLDASDGQKTVINNIYCNNQLGVLNDPHRIKIVQLIFAIIRQKKYSNQFSRNHQNNSLF